MSIYLEVHRSNIYVQPGKKGRDRGSLILGIFDENGGHRIAGPKFGGNTECLLKHRLTADDARSIMTYLKKVEEA